MPKQAKNKNLTRKRAAGRLTPPKKGWDLPLSKELSKAKTKAIAKEHGPSVLAVQKPFVVNRMEQLKAASAASK